MAEEEQLATLVVERAEIARLTLCGSTRFRAEYELWNKRLTLAGFLVYSVSGFGHSGDTFTPEEKRRLDQIHLAKIDASHAIVVINPDGYIGESTAREIEHAERSGKSVYYTHVGDRTVYQLRTGPDGGGSLRYRAFDYAPTPEQTQGAVEVVVREGLANIDKVEAKCPANRQRLGDKLCPKCQAGPNEGCRPDIIAMAQMVSDIRAAFKKSEVGHG